MAGMFAARVLSEHFQRVTVVDRDRYDDNSEYRSGVPQSRHLHILLERGQRIARELFPELESQLVAAGVPLLNMGRDVEFVTFGGKVLRYHSRHELRSSSRGWLENTLRSHLRQQPELGLVEGVDVHSLYVRADGQVCGVRGKRKHGEEFVLYADLVVDASGRNSKALEWLGALGYAAPGITTINAFLGYATRWFRIAPRAATPWRAVLTGAQPTSNPRGGALFPVEGDRWVVTLAGIGEHRPPTDDAGFLEFTRRLSTPTIYEAIKDAEPLSPVYGYRRTENRWVHFERLSRWPEGFVVLGDAACAFNPVYGQGMTVSAMEASLLGELLEVQGADIRGLSRRFQRRLPQVLKAPWLLATGEDFRWPTTEGGKPDAATRVAHWYVDRVFEIMSSRADVVETFLAVQHLLAAPTALFRPTIFARVMTHAARSLVARGRAQPSATLA